MATNGSLRGNLLIAHGGGPTAVINSSLYGVIREAFTCSEIEGIYGARFGTEGLLGSIFIDLRKQSAAEIELLPQTPASVLGSSRRRIQVGDYERILDNLRKQDIRFFLFNGGNGTMLAASELAHLGSERGQELRVIGIPKTVDNDMAETDHTPGYGSAARYMALTALEVGRDNEALPFPVCILETMGRSTGWLAAATALAAASPDEGPQLVYVPEIPFHRERFLADVEATYRRTGRAFVVVVEGIRDVAGEPVFNTSHDTDRDGFGRPLGGNVSVHLADLVSRELRLRVRNDKPGLCARCSAVHISRIDREEAEACGRFAVREAVKGTSGMMVILRRTANRPYRCELDLAPLTSVARRERLLPREYMNECGNYPAQLFREYALPLTGEDFPRFARFDLGLKA